VWIDEPALFSDVVFPDFTKMENLGLQSYARMFQNGLQGTMIIQPVVKPLYGARSLLEI
jgi:anaerobic selenocysteine-containing dehydrogenase